ncbi:MAG: hypothetical protein AB2L09_11760 [Coriobacteriia bacterium]
MKGTQMTKGNMVVRTGILLAALLAIGLITRFPALQFPYLYALHGVLAAPFFAALAMWHFTHRGGVGLLAIATLGMAAILGAMSAIMGLSFLLLAVCLVVSYALLKRLVPSTRNLVCAITFGALQYPCALVVGILSGSYLPSGDSVPVILLLVLISVGLAMLGGLLLAHDR